MPKSIVVIVCLSLTNLIAQDTKSPLRVHTPSYFIDIGNPAGNKVDRGSSNTVAVTRLSGASFEFRRDGFDIHPPINKTMAEKNLKDKVVSLGFVGQLHGKDNQAVKLSHPEGSINYFIGEPSRWKTDLPAYKQLTYAQVWRDIDFEFLGFLDRLEYRVVVGPGGDPSDIFVATHGKSHQVVNRALQVEYDTGVLSFGAPIAYQTIDGTRVAVDIEYTFSNLGFSFEIAPYSPDHALVIDPVIAWSGFFGGSDSDTSKSIATDVSGNVYFAGNTSSSDFNVNGYDVTANGFSDIFVTKLDPTATNLIYSTYLGGTSSDQLGEMVLDTSGNVYLVGTSSSSSYPVTTGAYDLTYNGGDHDIFVTKLDASGSSLGFSTYVGGSLSDWGLGLALNDRASGMYVVGYSESVNFPTTAGAFDQTHNGDDDVVVFRLSSSGASLTSSTYIGGSLNDQGHAIYVDAPDIIVGGWTSSANFPTSPGAYATMAYGNVRDGFVLRMESLSALEASTYVYSEVTDVKRAPDQTIYAVGVTADGQFPTTVGAYDRSHNGADDMFVVGFGYDCDTFLYGTFVGGTGVEHSDVKLALDEDGDVYIGGGTFSTDFPVTANAIDPTANGLGDGVVVKLAADGSSLDFSSYIGGTAAERLYSIALNDCGDVYVTGRTRSADFPATFGSYNADWDPFVALIELTYKANLAPKIQARGLNDPVFTLETTGAAGPLTINWSAMPATPLTVGAQQVTMTPPPSVTTALEASVLDTDSGDTLVPNALLLVSQNPLFFDYNVDGCNNLIDLWMLFDDWHLPFPNDPDGSGVIDIKDFLYINLDDSLLFCP